MFNQLELGIRSRHDNFYSQHFKQKNLVFTRRGSASSWVVTLTTSSDNTGVYLGMCALETLMSVSAVIPGIAALDTSPFPLPLSFCRPDEM